MKKRNFHEFPLKADSFTDVDLRKRCVLRTTSTVLRRTSCGTAVNETAEDLCDFNAMAPRQKRRSIAARRKTEIQGHSPRGANQEKIELRKLRTSPLRISQRKCPLTHPKTGGFPVC